MDLTTATRLTRRRDLFPDDEARTQRPKRPLAVECVAHWISVDKAGGVTQVWQIAAGDGARNYADLFLKHGLACVGPGDPGPYDEKPENYREGQTGHRPFMRPFCTELVRDDLLLLKRGAAGGLWAVEAIGRVDGPYTYEPRLEDVEGWDLQHSVPVRWRVPDEPRLIAGLTRGTLKRVQKDTVQQIAIEMWDELEGAERRPEPLAAAANELKDEDLIGRLIDGGVASGRAVEIQQTIWRIRRLARWYGRKAGWVSEHEIRTFLIVPLLLALGWPEQRINIEYEHLDIALWDRTFDHEEARLATVIETKKLWVGLDGGPTEQAKGYAARYDHCDRLVVSDGFRYKLLELDRASGNWTATAYANLLKLRYRHGTDPAIAGAGELFVSLLP